MISALVLLRGPLAFDLKIMKTSGFPDIFLLKSPRTVIPYLGTHRTELRQVRADFEVFEWSLTVLRARSELPSTFSPVSGTASSHREGPDSKR